MILSGIARGITQISVDKELLAIYTANMKKNDAGSQPATKKDLKKLEKHFDKKFATKRDLEQGLKSVKEDLRGEIRGVETRTDIKMDRMEDRTDEKAKGYRDEVLTKMDGIIGELQTMREEQVIANHHTAIALKRLDDHEGRITTLEKRPQI